MSSSYVDKLIDTGKIVSLDDGGNSSRAEAGHRVVEGTGLGGVLSEPLKKRHAEFVRKGWFPAFD